MIIYDMNFKNGQIFQFSVAGIEPGDVFDFVSENGDVGTVRVSKDQRQKNGNIRLFLEELNGSSDVTMIGYGDLRQDGTAAFPRGSMFEAPVPYLIGKLYHKVSGEEFIRLDEFGGEVKAEDIPEQMYY